MHKGGEGFHVVGAAAVERILASRRGAVMDAVANAYLAHAAGRTVNPDSHFLRFPDRPSARIIALPARLEATAGIKWIASFPENRDHDLPRASAVVILNDMVTGFPQALLEGSGISAARTAASAALAAERLAGGRRAQALAVIGAGPIAATVLDYLQAAGWAVGEIRVHDLVPARAQALADRALDTGAAVAARVAASIPAAVDGADLVLFATTAGVPHLQDPGLFTRRHTVLHLSLRDLAVPVILAGQNVVDDIDHALKAQTSVHLAEQATGGRGFIAGTLADLLAGRLAPDAARPRFFSPFGLGILDLAVARLVLEEAVAAGEALAVDGFLPSSTADSGLRQGGVR
ncbi:MAG: 2,3-diaminopropionate biosynthesis protein SbnB [Azospirillaceae bacterium]|nr:2,3-diaminopropionate biosynthesis protein SbnB [Azospirillaceae bacterium]